MAWDAHANFAISTIATAPSPATTGTSVVVAAGQGARFPTVPFNAVIWPAGASQTPSNAEVVRVTARSTDTLTIARTQEASSARTVVVGDQIAVAITAKTFTDIEDLVSARRYTPVNTTPSIITVPGMSVFSTGTRAIAAGWDTYQPIYVEDWLTFDQVLMEVTTAGASSVIRSAIFNANAAYQPTTLIEEFPTMSAATTGVKTTTPSGGSRTLPPGRYLSAFNLSVGATVRQIRGSLSSAMIPVALGASPISHEHAVTRAHAAFPTNGVAWTTVTAGSIGYSCCMFLRVTVVG